MTAGVWVLEYSNRATGKPNCRDGFACGDSCIARNKECERSLAGRAREYGNWLAHAADHIAENVVSWKVGKVVGGAIAQAAITHGAPEVVTEILAETAIQATAATALHYAKNRDSSARDLASHFVQQATAAFLGKDAHFFAEQRMEELSASVLYQQLVPLISGKAAGVGTASGLGRSGLDRKVVDLVVDRSKADLAKVQTLFDRTVENAERVAAQEEAALGRLLYEALVLAVAIREAG